MNAILNVAAYRFVPLPEPHAWRERVHAAALANALKGTVLIAHEGLNLALASGEPAVRAFLGWLARQPPFEGLAVRESWSQAVPFGRLRVKVKPEIIRMNRPAIRPAAGRAPAVAPETLTRWLDAGHDDAGREVVLLDTRNAFEVDAGRFRGAHDWRLSHFSDFPAAFEARRASLEGKTVVSYCTGGIRCEKAALLMTEAGLDHVWQLDGGILGHLQTTGGRHYDGACVVFDARGMLTDTLQPVAPV